MNGVALVHIEHVHLHSQESRNALLERMPVFHIRHLTGFKMLIKPTFEHADACSPRVESDHDLKPNNETNQPPVRQQRKTTIALVPRAT